jgi:hypothetical protein
MPRAKTPMPREAVMPLVLLGIAAVVATTIPCATSTPPAGGKGWLP